MPAHKVIQPTKQCRACGITFSKPPHRSHAKWETTTSCSFACGARRKNFNGTYQPLVKFCKNCKEPFLKARKDTHEHFAKQEYCCISCSKIGKNVGDKSPSWVGDDIQYGGLHDWIRTNYGKPLHCEYCNSKEKRMYHWANISNEYKRDRNDWVRLCVSHHKMFDLYKSNPTKYQKYEDVYNQVLQNKNMIYFKYVK